VALNKVDKQTNKQNKNPFRGINYCKSIFYCSLLLKFVIMIVILIFWITVRGGRMPHITQIAAKIIGTNDKFSAYIIPKMPISSTAQDITGIVYNNSGTMTVRGKPVEPKTLSSVVTEFCDWLAQYPNVFSLRIMEGHLTTLCFFLRRAVSEVQADLWIA
jgi:hypothetical protein